MALILSKKDREWLENQMHSAKPYDDDDPILRTLDGERDGDRWSATMARRFLKQAGVLTDDT